MTFMFLMLLMGSAQHPNLPCQPVLRIRDILVQIRIRGSVPLLFEATFTSFLKIKVIKKSQNSRNQGFDYFSMIAEGSGAGSIPRINGSGFGRPKTFGSAILLPTNKDKASTCRTGSNNLTNVWDLAIFRYHDYRSKTILQILHK
jgi:hypothetical protein